MKEDMMIDAVITWVDGNDPVLNAKRAAFCGEETFKQEDVASATRFANLGEIHWCVKSINKFAPWIRKIYIITDSQDPHVESKIPVEIVDHKEIFKGYEEYLPTFNSLAIEAMMWRIPGLSEKFLYFNDDFFLCAPIVPEDFFTADSRPIFYCHWKFTPWIRLLSALKPKQNGRSKVTQKRVILNALDIAGKNINIPFPEHIPSALLRSGYESYFSDHDEILRLNARYRTRDANQYIVDGLLYFLLRKEKACEFRRYQGLLFYFKPRGGMEYYEKKFRKLDRKNSYKFVCLNSLDLATPEVREKVIARINDILA